MYSSTVYEVVLKHRTKSKTLVARLPHGDIAWSEAGAASVVLTKENANEEWELKKVRTVRA